MDTSGSEKARGKTVRVSATQDILNGWLSAQEIEAANRASEASGNSLRQQDSYQGPLYKRLCDNPEAKAAFSLIEPSLFKQDWSEAIRLLNFAANCLKESTLLNPSMATAFAKAILHYPFREVTGASDQIIGELRARWSFVTLMEASLVSPGHWLLERELIAVLLGSDYDVTLDPARILKEGFDSRPDAVEFMPPPHSTPLAERRQHCPLYPEFANLPFEVRRGITYAIHCNFSGDIAAGACLREYLHEEYSMAVDGMVTSGYLRRDLQPADYLSHLTTGDLKTILKAHGIQPKGKKSDLVQAIRGGLAQEEIRHYVGHLVNSDDHRLCIETGRLRRLLYDEKERFARWGVWLSRTLAEDQRRPVPVPVPNPNWREEFEARQRIKPVLKFDRSVLREVSALPIWNSYWDEECDHLVSDFGQRLGWNGFQEAALSIEAHWGDVKALQFEQDSRQLAEEFRQKGNASYYQSLLELRCEAKRLELGITGPAPRRRDCEACGIYFSEDSIPPRLAKLAGYQLGFCRNCLSVAFYGQAESAPGTMVSRQDLLDKLITLSRALEQIPASSFVQSPRLPLGIEPERAKHIIAALIALPSYKVYLAEFGSWLAALIASKILADQPVKAMRGYKSLATDGHVCYSLAELAIDNWLSAHGVSHEKEPMYPFHPNLNSGAQLRADWKHEDCYIEYFGMMEDSEYRTRAETKTKLAQAVGLRLVVILPDDMLSLDDKLGALLER